MPTVSLLASLENVQQRGKHSAGVPVIVNNKPYLLTFGQESNGSILSVCLADIKGESVSQLNADTGRTFMDWFAKPWIVTVNQGKIYASILAFENGILDIFDAVIDPEAKTISTTLRKQISLPWMDGWPCAFYTRIVGRMAYIMDAGTGVWHMVDLENDVDHDINTGSGTYDYQMSKIIMFRVRDEAGTKIVRPLMLIGRHLAGDPYRLYDCVRLEVVTELGSFGTGSPRVQLGPAIFHDKFYLFLANGGAVNATNYIGIVDGDTLNEIFRTEIGSIVSGRNEAIGGIPLFRTGNNVYFLCLLNTLKSGGGDVSAHLLKADLVNHTITNELTIRTDTIESDHGYNMGVFNEGSHMPGVYLDPRSKKAYFVYRIDNWSVTPNLQSFYLYELDFSDMDVDEYNALLNYLGLTGIPTQLTLQITPL